MGVDQDKDEDVYSCFGDAIAGGVDGNARK